MVRNDLKVGNVIAEPGELKPGYIKGVELDFQNFNIPIIVANGKHKGPILCITSGIHGTEISGIEVIRRVLMEEVDVNELHGSIIALTVCNPLAFAWHEHSTPQDFTNMSRVFPGNPDGSLTQRLAYRIWTEAILKSQYMIDIHHDGWPAIPYVECTSEAAPDKETEDKTLEMAKAVGLTILHSGKVPFWGPPPPGACAGSITEATVMEGIPTVTLELNAPMGKIINDVVDVGVRGALNVMKYLKMIPGEFEKYPESVYVIPGEFVFKVAEFPKTTRGGIMVMEKTPGEIIREGETIATIYSVLGEKLEKVKMTVDGRIWAYQLNSLLHEGSVVAYIFAEWEPETMK